MPGGAGLELRRWAGERQTPHPCIFSCPVSLPPPAARDPTSETLQGPPFFPAYLPLALPCSGTPALGDLDALQVQKLLSKYLAVPGAETAGGGRGRGGGGWTKAVGWAAGCSARLSSPKRHHGRSRSSCSMTQVGGVRVGAGQGPQRLRAGAPDSVPVGCPRCQRGPLLTRWSAASPSGSWALV